MVPQKRQIGLFLLSIFSASITFGMPESMNIHGSADIGFFGGGATYPAPAGGTSNTSFDVADVRFFITADFESSDFYQAAGFNLEWNLIRTRELYNFVGEAYFDLQGLWDNQWLNLQVGRFQIPVTENYLRFSNGKGQNPFVSQTAGGLWYWDEGLKIYGSTKNRGFGYIFSLTDGESNMGENMLSDFSTEVDADFNASKQTTLRLFSQLNQSWYASASFFATGEVGMSALWFGESSVKPLGMAGSPLEYIDGVAAAPGGANDNVIGAGFDLIYETNYLRLWLDVAELEINSPEDIYDRNLQILSLEAIIQGSLLSRELVNNYIGLRYSDISTGDANRGYLFDRRYMNTVGWNMESYAALSLVVGQRISKNLTAKIEYTALNIDLVNGAQAYSDAVSDNNYAAIVLTAQF